MIFSILEKSLNYFNKYFVNINNGCIFEYQIKQIMKRFNFKAQLKGLDLTSLQQLKSKHLDYMLSFAGYNEKEADKQLRYIGYIDEQIKKISN